MRSYDCPSCGATLKFESSIAVSAVCSYCTALIVRRDLDVESLGKIAQLPPDLSPLQIGTTGNCRGTGFRLAGRLRWHWSGGSWTEWFAECTDGGYGWLAETQGFYTFSRETTAHTLPPIGLVSAGQTPTIGDTDWEVIDIKEAECVAAEGELPEVLPPGRRRTSADLQTAGARFATLEDGPNGTEMFEGHFARFEELSFMNLRAVPYWTPGVEGERIERKASTFGCPNCAAPVEVRAAGLSMSIVCGSCGTIIDTSDEKHRMLENAADKIRAVAPKIPIGKRGTFRGTEYEVVGFMRRSDGFGEWSEYLLFNPWHGFDWLVSSSGHWTFVERLLDPPSTGVAGVPPGYRPFANYNSNVVGVLGEFYWQTSTSELTQVSDFVHPPSVLSREVYPGLAEITWSKGDYVPGAEVSAAFGEGALEPVTGTYLNQPNPWQEKWQRLKRLFFVGALLLLLVQIFSPGGGSPREVLKTGFTYRKSDASRVFSSDVIVLDGRASKVEIEATSNLVNAWMSLDFSLVEEGTETRYDQEIDLEYYSGVDSDGSWTEGSKSKSSAIAAVPPGKYRLMVQAEADPKLIIQGFTVRLERGGTFFSNFILCLFFLSIYPLYVLMRSAIFEQRRWSQSDLGGTSGAASSSSDD